MINYDSFSRCHLTDIFFAFHAGAKELKTSVLEDNKCRYKRPFLRQIALTMVAKRSCLILLCVRFLDVPFYSLIFDHFSNRCW